MRSVFSVSRLLVAVATVTTSVGVSLLVSSFSAPTTVALPQWAGPNYRQDVRGFQPVTRNLLTDLKHANPATPGPTPHPTPSGSATLPSPLGAPASHPTPVAFTPAPPPAPAPRLVVAMSADKTEAKQRDTITYMIRVANGGTSAANRVVIESHVPDGTTLRSWTCNGKTVTANGATSFTCGDPGTPKPDHPLVWAFPTLAAGTSVTVQFSVRIDPAVPHNANIVDHAHAYASNTDLTDSDDVSVIVR